MKTNLSLQKQIINKKLDKLHKKRSEYINSNQTIKLLNQELPNLNKKWRDAIKGKKQLMAQWDAYISEYKKEFSESRKYLINYKNYLAEQFNNLNPELLLSHEELAILNTENNVVIGEQQVDHFSADNMLELYENGHTDYIDEV